MAWRALQLSLALIEGFCSGWQDVYPLCVLEKYTATLYTVRYTVTLCTLTYTVTQHRQWLSAAMP